MTSKPYQRRSVIAGSLPRARTPDLHTINLKPGRPTKATDGRRKALLSLTRRGHTISDASRAVGICEDTVTNWIRVLPGFSAQLQAAREEAILVLEDRILAAARRDWRAAVWILERRHPERFGRPQEPMGAIPH